MSEKPRITLDPGQRAAVDAPAGNATNVIAGAGTGKTSVLVARYLKLIEDGLPVERVLALTFTLKAAGEMRERVRRAVGERHPELLARMPGAWIMNFHQFGYRFIKENAPALGIDPGVDVMSIAEFSRIQRVLRARFENGRVPGVPSDFGGSPPPPTKLGSLFDTLMRVVLHCRGIMLDTAELRAMAKPDDHPAYIARVDTVVALAREYENELARRGLLDFSDMIAIPARALRENRALASAYQKAFDHILVDEFQDTSAAQNELLRSLAGGDLSRVTVVGDKKQSIYRWRDARVENIDDFPDDDPRQLSINYRSHQQILDLAHALITREDELKAAAVPLTAFREDGETSAVLFHPLEGADHHADEAEALGAWVDNLLGRAAAPTDWGLSVPEHPLQPHDIAVLVRNFKSSKLMPEVERVFRRRGIPFAVVGGANRAEARALESWHSWLSLLLPGDRDVDLVAVLEASPYGVTEASLTELLRDGRPAPVLERLDDANIARVTDGRDATAMRDVRVAVERTKTQWRNLGFREFLVWAIETSPLRTRLLRDGAQPAAVDELARELLDLSDGLARRGELSLASFLDHLRASLDERKFREDGEAALPQGRVAVMTIHQAKGLEFDAVAVVGVVEGSTPSESFLVSRESGLYFGEKTGKPWGREKERAENHIREEHMEEVEERCVLYVGLTRARDHLWVSSPSAEGMKYYKSKDPKPWLFTELVESAREQHLGVEIREVSTGAEEAAGAQTHATAPTNESIERALKEWVELRAQNAPQAHGVLEPEGILTVTWADIAAFARCPLQFQLNKLRARDGVEAESERPESDAVHSGEYGDSAVPPGVEPTEFGSFVHEVLHRLTSGGDLDTAIRDSLARYGFGKKAGLAADTARALVENAVSAGVAGPKPGARSEVPFMVRLNHIIVRGTIDRIDVTDEGTTITDYKVGNRSEDHEWQVQTYTWAVERTAVAAPIRPHVAYLRASGVEVTEIAGGTIEQAANAIDEAVSSGTFVATPGAVCNNCVHRSVCQFSERKQ